jgi:hypothetical protein
MGVSVNLCKGAAELEKHPRACHVLDDFGCHNDVVSTL